MSLFRPLPAPPPTPCHAVQDMVARGCERNVITYSSLISACERSGRCDIALRLFEEMRREGCRPNVVSWLVAWWLRRCACCGVCAVPAVIAEQYTCWSGLYSVGVCGALPAGLLGSVLNHAACRAVLRPSWATATLGGFQAAAALGVHAPLDDCTCLHSSDCLPACLAPPPLTRMCRSPTTG